MARRAEGDRRIRRRHPKPRSHRHLRRFAEESGDERGPGGFSLVEALVASAIVAGVVLLGASLIARSTVDTLVGRRHTEVSRLAGASQEELLSLPVDREALTIPDGLEALELEAHRALVGNWREGPAGEGTSWRRRTRVRCFAVADLYDQAPSEPAVLEEPLPGGVDPSSALVRVVDVVVSSEAGPAPIGAPSRLSLITVRAY